MAGSLTVQERYFGRQRAMICTCVSDASGNVNAKPFEVQGGNLYAIYVLPVSGVSDLWDLTLTCGIKFDDGTVITFADILSGEGANLSNSTDGDRIVLSEPWAIPPKSILTPVIANLGNAQTVYVIFDIWEEIG